MSISADVCVLETTPKNVYTNFSIFLIKRAFTNEMHDARYAKNMIRYLIEYNTRNETQPLDLIKDRSYHIKAGTQVVA